ncbi:MAG: hypothetical protein H0V56_03460 [Chthoniobacterales bacterium]|nr:hypothetical protein [Chthoniobacterales bacterium]
MLVASARSASHLEARDFIPLDLTGWDCLDKPGGTGKTPDTIERNTGKNRPLIDLTGMKVPNFDTAGFLRHVSAFDAQTKGKRRKDLNATERTQLQALEQQVVSLTAYLVMAYAGPPESTNCGSVDFHDWHLEMFEKPQDHPPRPGDPTPIICETAPRTQTAVYRSGARVQQLSGFFRRPDLVVEPTSQKPQLIRITGYLLWDDDHNGKADIGPKIETVSANGYHRPWRSTPWEIHPVLKIERADGQPFSAAAPATAAAAESALSPAAIIKPAPPPAAAAPQEVTIVAPIIIKVRYGETVLQRGMRLPLLKRDAQTVTVNYLGQPVAIPLEATDLR